MDFSYKNFKVGTCAGQKEVDGETMPILSQPPEHNKSDRESRLNHMCARYGCIPLHAFSTPFKAWKTTPRNTWGCLLASSLQQKLNFQVQREDFAILDESKEAVLSCLSSK
ncbi:hypothetical protein NC652_021255 [Populus alba x Populus x berolinensis]|nr:hypothetical protein NC652_021255 [Populus alba x Populus x berolinensis]